MVGMKWRNRENHDGNEYRSFSSIRPVSSPCPFPSSVCEKILRVDVFGFFVKYAY